MGPGCECGAQPEPAGTGPGRRMSALVQKQTNMGGTTMSAKCQ